MKATTGPRTEINIRFPEFKERHTKLKLLDVCNGGITNGVFNDPSKRKGAYRLVNVLDMFGTDQINVAALTYLHLEQKEFERNQVKFGDIFFTRSSLVPAGIAWSNVFLSHENNVTFDGHLMKITPNLTKFSSEYLAQYFRSSQIRKQLVVRGKTGTMTTIGQSDIASVELNVPSLSEQRKIADFLTAVDERIGQLIRKRDLLEEYKKGVMQQLFSQTIRFKDDNGNDFPEWEEKKLGEVGEITTGKTPPTSKPELWNGETMFVTPSDINDRAKFQVRSERRVQGNSVRLIPTNSVMFTCIGSIGKISISTESCLTNQQINSISVFSAINFEFIYYVLLKRTPKIRATQANTTLPIINKTEFSKFTIPFPSLPEQTKIANFLSAIDRRIEQVSAQISETQTFKRGLLQQMFV